VDECLANIDNCDVNANCINVPGSFDCVCNSGYTGDGVACNDFDECLAHTDNCDVNAHCLNKPGSFLCKCNPGFVGNGVTCVCDAESDAELCSIDNHSCGSAQAVDSCGNLRNLSCGSCITADKCCYDEFGGNYCIKKTLQCFLQR